MKSIQILLVSQILIIMRLGQTMTINKSNYFYGGKYNEDSTEVPLNAKNPQARIRRYQMENYLKAKQDDRSLQPVQYLVYTPGFVSNILYQLKKSAADSQPDPVITISNVQPIETDSEILHVDPKLNANLTSENEEDDGDAASDTASAALPFVNYNNKILHLNKPIIINNNNENHAHPLHTSIMSAPPPSARKQRKAVNYSNDEKSIAVMGNDHEQAQNQTEASFLNNSTDIQSSDYDDNDDDEAASQATPLTTASPSSQPASYETRYFQDIFLNYMKPHHVNYGHVQLTPQIFEKRFETLKAGNRYKGEVISLDNTGAYSEHHWDLAQGKL